MKNRERELYIKLFIKGITDKKRLDSNNPAWKCLYICAQETFHLYGPLACIFSQIAPGVIGYKCLLGELALHGALLHECHLRLQQQSDQHV